MGGAVPNSWRFLVEIKVIFFYASEVEIVHSALDSCQYVRGCDFSVLQNLIPYNGMFL
jgi:hypothetical protein